MIGRLRYHTVDMTAV